MYSGRGFRESEIGDIDVIVHEGTFHLFHLILPNHDYIAHAVSDDGIHWRRVRNALWVGDPGQWDDDMLWTMHVSRDAENGGFRMLYTGLSQSENGYYQRIGLARSDDLYTWTKVEGEGLPLAPHGHHYECIDNNARTWVSFRDPFFYQESDGTQHILFNARIPRGPVHRRGCVGMATKVDGRFALQPPLFISHTYDDVECPCAFSTSHFTYLIGSIREDIKVHYWYADSFAGPYRAFHNNVLMPKGNYAARIAWDGDHLLLFAFYADGPDVETARKFLPPPKELDVGVHGKLVLRTYHRWSSLVAREVPFEEFAEGAHLLDNPHARAHRYPHSLSIACVSGYEIYAFPAPSASFIWEGRLTLLGVGKCGLVFNADDAGDGYFVSLDMVQGYVQIRVWHQNPANIYRDFVYETLQDNVFAPNDGLTHRFRLIRYKGYIELAIDEVVVLALVDARLDGSLVGMYCESTELILTESRMLVLEEKE